MVGVGCAAAKVGAALVLFGWRVLRLGVASNGDESAGDVMAAREVDAGGSSLAIALAEGCCMASTVGEGATYDVDSGLGPMPQRVDSRPCPAVCDESGNTSASTKYVPPPDGSSAGAALAAAASAPASKVAAAEVLVGDGMVADEVTKLEGIEVGSATLWLVPAGSTREIGPALD